MLNQEDNAKQAEAQAPKKTRDVLIAMAAAPGYRLLDKREIFEPGDLWGYSNEPDSIVYEADGFVGCAVSVGSGDDFFGVRRIEAVEAKPEPSSPKSLDADVLVDALAEAAVARGIQAAGGKMQGETVYDVDCRFRAARAALVARLSRMGEMERALKLAIQEFKHDVPDSCWSTGPLTGTAEDNICRGCMVIQAALSSLKGGANG
jgi:hypothetical protein